MWVAGLNASCPLADPSPVENISDLKLNTQPQLTPRLQTIDADIRQSTQILEDKFRDAGVVDDDPELTAYINSLLTAEDLGVSQSGFHLNVKVLKMPDENAFACPSGTIYLNAGLFPLVQNADELRFVLAHEAMHVLGKHAVFHDQSSRNQTTFIKLLDIVITPAASVMNIYTDFQYSSLISGISQLTGTSAGLFYIASVQGYGRAQEIEADNFGCQVMYRLRKNTNAAVTFFTKFKEDQEKYEGKSFTHFASSHEAPQDRVKRVAQFMPEAGRKPESFVEREFMEKTRRARLDSAEINIKLGRVRHALDSLEQLTKLDLKDARIYYLLGEAYRRLSEDPDLLKSELIRKEWTKIIKPGDTKIKEEWLSQSQGFYQKSLEADPQQAEASRGLAALCEQRGEWANAQQYYSTYLQLRPGSTDQRYVKAKIKSMQDKLTAVTTASENVPKEKKK